MSSRRSRVAVLAVPVAALLMVSWGAPVANAVVPETTRVSVDSYGEEGDSSSYSPSISADGRYVAFDSWASNLGGWWGDGNDVEDVFVHDRERGETTRVSIPTYGDEANDRSQGAAISADGRYVAFQSSASNLLTWFESDTNDCTDVFVHDTFTGETTRVSVSNHGEEAESYCFQPSISGDGRYVAFHSDASNLSDSFFDEDTNVASDVFVHDRETGDTTRVSVATDGEEGDSSSYQSSISRDGRYVAFFSWSSNLVPGDTNGAPDVFVHDRDTGETTRMSVSTSGAGGNGGSVNPAISADGRYVAFTSGASNLVAGDTNAFYDIFVRDRQTGQTTRVGAATGEAAENGSCEMPSISGDGRFVTFQSSASNLVRGDGNADVDVFVHDRQTGRTARVSVATGGTEGNAPSSHAMISEDGRCVAFGSAASTLVEDDGNGADDVFVRILGDIPENTAPVGGHDAYQTNKGVELVVPAPGVLGNDSDADGDAMTAHLVSNVTHGSLVLAPSGAFIYTPAQGFAGTDAFTYQAHDGEGYSGTCSVQIAVKSPVVPLVRTFVSMAGSNRYETAIAASKRAFPSGAGAVVIATGLNWPDALGGATLAGAHHGPILLTPSSSLPAAVKAEIRRLGAKKAIVLGGTSAVSRGVENALKAQIGTANVSRIGGANRYETANLVAKAAVAKQGGAFGHGAFVATGENFPDALAASPVAASAGMPIYLVAKGGLSATTKSAMRACGVNRVIVLGQTGAVSMRVEGDVKRMCGGNVTRLGGSNRYATGAAVAQWGVSGAGLSWNKVAIATGQNFPDALAGGVLQGEAHSVLLLTPGRSLDPAAAAKLRANKAVIGEVRFLGGEAALSRTVRSQVANALR